MCLFTNQENRDLHHDNDGIGDDNVDHYDDYGSGQENRDDPYDNDDGDYTTDVRSKELGCNESILIGQNCTSTTAQNEDVNL